MKSLTLPNQLHRKQEFQKSKSLYSTPDDSENIQLSPFNLLKTSRVTISVDRVKKKRFSNILDWAIRTQKSQSFFFFIFQKFLFPHLLAFAAVFGVMKLENVLELECPKEGEKTIIYLISREIVLGNFIYSWTIYILLFETNKNFLLKVFLFAGCFIIIFFFQYFERFEINDQETHLDKSIFPCLFLMITFIVITFCKGKISKKDYKKVGLSLCLVFIGGVDFIVFRHFIIEKVHSELRKFDHDQIYFQLFLFISYQIFGNILIKLFQKFKNNISQNLFLLLIKIYISSVICSCIVLPLTRGNGLATSSLAFLNFFLQITSFYKQKNLFLHKICSFFEKKYKKSCPIFKIFRGNINDDVSSIIAGSTNELVISMTSVLINIKIFGKTIRFPTFDVGQSKKNSFCKKFIGDVYEIGVENVCFLFGINFFLFLYLILKMKDDNRTTFKWKIESYGVLMKTYYNIMIYFLIDLDFQFYLYLYLIGKSKLEN